MLFTNAPFARPFASGLEAFGRILDAPVLEDGFQFSEFDSVHSPLMRYLTTVAMDATVASAKRINPVLRTIRS